MTLRSKAPRLTFDDMQRITWSNREALDTALARALAAASDSGAKERRKEHWCRWCFYFRRGGLAGQAFTDAECGCCGVTMTFSSTAVDRICEKCASKYSLCRHCGGDIDELVRRMSRKRLLPGET